MNKAIAQGWVHSAPVLPVRLILHSLHLIVHASSWSWQGEAAQPNETSSLLGLGRDSKESAERKGMLVKAALYAVQVFYSFFIM
jgi:hypothetical protein